MIKDWLEKKIKEYNWVTQFSPRHHHQKFPHHFLGSTFAQLKPLIEEVERRKKIRDEIRRGRNRDDVRDIDIRPKTRFIHQNANTKIPKRGVTYHYGLDNDKKLP